MSMSAYMNDVQYFSGRVRPQNQSLAVHLEPVYMPTSPIWRPLGVGTELLLWVFQ